MSGWGWWLRTLHSGHCVPQTPGLLFRVAKGVAGPICNLIGPFQGSDSHPSPTDRFLDPEPFFSWTIPPCFPSWTRGAHLGECELCSPGERGPKLLPVKSKPDVGPCGNADPLSSPAMSLYFFFENTGWQRASAMSGASKQVVEQQFCKTDHLWPA